MNKKILALIFLSISLFVLIGCTKQTIYFIRWEGWEINPEKPVVNELVHIHVKYLNKTDGDKTVVYHWAITEGGTQKEYVSYDADLYLPFDTAGTKEVFLWAEGVNYGEYFSSKPYFFEFEVSEF